MRTVNITSNKRICSHEQVARDERDVYFHCALCLTAVCLLMSSINTNHHQQHQQKRVSRPSVLNCTDYEVRTCSQCRRRRKRLAVRPQNHDLLLLVALQGAALFRRSSDCMTSWVVLRQWGRTPWVVPWVAGGSFVVKNKKKKKKISHIQTARSAAWELIPFSAL